MKTLKINFFFIAFAAILLAFLSGCKPDPVEESAGGLDGTRLWGNITEDVTLAANGTYELDGGVHVKNGATLTINEGVTLLADASKTSYLLIEQGGNINAIGTASSPIVMTSNATNPDRGDWGGVIVCGKASINATGGTGVTEVGNATYGGTDDADNSGTLSYIRVEYSGVSFDEEHEANGFAFYSLGTGTTLDHLQSYKGGDDGFEFFGGTVNAKYLVSTYSKDDSFDWTEGWRGNGQFWIANQMVNDGDRGIEADNYKNNNVATPYSNPKLSNITLIGGGNEEGYGMKLREGTKGQFVNIIIDGFAKRGIHVEHNQSILNVNDESLDVDYAKIESVVSDVPIKYSVSQIQSDQDEDNDGDIDEDDLINDPNATPVDAAKKFEMNQNVSIEAINTVTSTTFTGGTDPSVLWNAWFTSTTQIGAGSDWTTGWTIGL
jgi:hypothetical protein